MSHQRQKIREEVAALLAVAPTNWQRVFVQREPLTRAAMPCLLVYTPSENSQPMTLHRPFLMQRDLTLIVQAHVRLPDPETVEQTFDSVAEEIETTLSLDKLIAIPALARLAGFVLLATQTDIVVNDNGERQYGELTMTWQAQYHTTEGNPA